MKRLLTSIALLFALVAPVWATPIAAPGCGTVSVLTSSTAVLSAPTTPGRLTYLGLVNTTALSPTSGCIVYCAYTSNNNASVGGGYPLQPLGGWFPGGAIPSSDVACIDNGSCSGSAKVYLCAW